MPSRPTSSIVQAVLANLEWAESIALDSAKRTEDGPTALYHNGQAVAYGQAIAIIKTEFAEYLEATP